MPGTRVGLEVCGSTQKMSAGTRPHSFRRPDHRFRQEDWRSRFAVQHHRAAPVNQLGGAS